MMGYYTVAGGRDDAPRDRRGHGLMTPDEIFEIIYEPAESIAFIYRTRIAGVCGPMTSPTPVEGRTGAEEEALRYRLLRSGAWTTARNGYDYAPAERISLNYYSSVTSVISSMRGHHDRHHLYHGPRRGSAARPAHPARGPQRAPGRPARRRLRCQHPRPRRARPGRRCAHCRALAAIEAGRPTVPMVLAADEGTDDAAQIERLVSQYAENEHRTGLILQRQLWWGLSAGAVVGGAGLGLASSAPPGPVRDVIQIGSWRADEGVEQAPEFRDGQRDELVGSGCGAPFSAVARVALR
jgi:hypothetical protein